MIVTCEQCQTKFRIPDEKVTDKGVKVRCTKCEHTFRVYREAPKPTKPVELDSADPFSRFGQSVEGPTRPGTFALGLESSRAPSEAQGPPPAKAVSPAAARPKAPRTSDAPSAPTFGPPTASPFDFSTVLPSGPVPPAPFDFGSLVGGPLPAVPPAPMAAAQPVEKPAAGPVSFDFSSLPPPLPGTAPAPAAKSSAPARPLEAPDMSFDFSSLGASAAAASSSGAPSAPPSSNLLGAIPPPSSSVSTLLDDDFFGAGGGRTESGLTKVPENATKEEARAALFDMSVAALPSVSTDSPDQVLPVLPPPEPADYSPTPLPVRVPNLPDPASARSRRVLGIIVNVLIAAILVCGLVVVGTATLNEGKLDGQAIVSTLRSLLTPPSKYVAFDISNGLYETRMGRPVFFVRGAVVNKTSSAARVRVRAELIDGSTVVRSAEVVAGSPPSPEELHRLASPDELKNLMERGAANAKPVDAGESAPFLVTFAEYPPDLKAFLVRVTATGEVAQTATAP